MNSDTAGFSSAARSTAASSLLLLDENRIAEPAGWPQYFPKRRNDTPGLCGTSYALLALDVISRLLDSDLIGTREPGRLLSSLSQKIEPAGGFVVDAHWPIPVIDSCWEGLLDLAVLAPWGGTALIPSTVGYVLSVQNQDGGWPIGETTGASFVFPTSQMVSALAAVASLLGSGSRLLERAATATRRGVDWLIAHQRPAGGWSDGAGDVSPVMTARAVLALSHAGVPGGDTVLTSAAQVLTGLTPDQVADAEPLNVRLFGGRFGVLAEDARLFRYSHCTSAWVLQGLIAVGTPPDAPLVGHLVADILDRQEDGSWPDDFYRFDEPSGRVAWLRKAESAVGPPSRVARAAVWPIYNNLAALEAYVAAVSR